MYVPYGSKDPNNRALEPKYHSYSSIWAPKPCYLGPWTLRGIHLYIYIIHICTYVSMYRCMYVLVDKCLASFFFGGGGEILKA